MNPRSMHMRIDLHPDLTRAIRRRLLAWYRRHRRDLRWRRAPNPYRIWVAETMLQQTQVARVDAFYERFIERFPNVRALTRVSLHDVLKAWAGMGYYGRARNLHAAARVMVEEHSGRVPDTVAGLRALPGAGRYTAAALASIAFGRPTPSEYSSASANAFRGILDGKGALFRIEHRTPDAYSKIEIGNRPSSSNRGKADAGR